MALSLIIFTTAFKTPDENMPKTTADDSESGILSSKWFLAGIGVACVLVLLLMLVITLSRCRFYFTFLVPITHRGLKRRVLQALPISIYQGGNGGGSESHDGATMSNFTVCAICLGEFANGDQVRELPQCNHRFHVVCVDTWLRHRSTCPTCRQILEESR